MVLRAIHHYFYLHFFALVHNFKKELLQIVATLLLLTMYRMNPFTVYIPLGSNCPSEELLRFCCDGENVVRVKLGRGGGRGAERFTCAACGRSALFGPAEI